MRNQRRSPDSRERRYRGTRSPHRGLRSPVERPRNETRGRRNRPGVTSAEVFDSRDSRQPQRSPTPLRSYKFANDNHRPRMKQTDRDSENSRKKALKRRPVSYNSDTENRKTVERGRSRDRIRKRSVSSSDDSDSGSSAPPKPRRNRHSKIEVSTHSRRLKQL